MPRMDKKFKILKDVTAAIITIFFAGVFAYLIWGEVSLQANKQPDLSDAQRLSEWSVIGGGDKSSKVTIPATVGVDSDNEATLTTALGEIPDSTDTLLIWSKGQELEVYFNDKLWYRYQPDLSDSVGIDSTYLYVFVPIPKNSSYSDLTIKYKSILDRDAGKIGDVYIGEKAAVIVSILSTYQLEFFLGIFVFLLGIIDLIVSTILYFMSKREVIVYYLGLASLILAFWVIANSRLRQFAFPNASIIRDCAYLVLPFITASFALYIDRLQHNRYHNAYLAIKIAAAVDLLVICVLHFGQILPLSDCRIGSLILIFALMVVVVITFARDIMKKLFMDYHISAIVIVSLIVFGLVQLIMEQVLQFSVISGTLMSIGIIIMVVCGLLQAIQMITQMNVDRERAIQKVENLSQDAMETLAKTVDAKDRYTSGHSMRVAEVSCIIAKELGWDESRIAELRFQGLMHDIGKIGVPDSVLNKPGRLTKIEFEIIQSHTVVGSDILRNLSSLPGVDQAARSHHERFDGNGYPDHLVGEEIYI